MNIKQVTMCTPVCLLALIGLTLFASPLAAQVFDSGPSDPALFDNVITVPTDPDIGDAQSVGDLTTQLNVTAGGSVGFLFVANAGTELNISDGSLGSSFDANSGSLVNIRGGSIGDGLSVNGTTNLFGRDLILDGESLEDGSSHFSYGKRNSI